MRHCVPKLRDPGVILMKLTASNPEVTRGVGKHTIRNGFRGRGNTEMPILGAYLMCIV